MISGFEKQFSQYNDFEQICAHIASEIYNRQRAKYSGQSVKPVECVYFGQKEWQIITHIGSNKFFIPGTGIGEPPLFMGLKVYVVIAESHLKVV